MSVIYHALYWLYILLCIGISSLLEILLFFVKHQSNFTLKDSVCSILYAKNLISNDDYEKEKKFASTLSSECLLGYAIFVAPIIPILKNRNTLNACATRRAKFWFKCVDKKNLYYRIALLYTERVGRVNMKLFSIFNLKVVQLSLPHLLLIFYIYVIVISSINITILLFIMFCMYLFLEISSQFWEINVTQNKVSIYSVIAIWFVAYIITLCGSFNVNYISNILNCILLVFLSSTLGFVLGHELCHKKNRWNIFLSKLMLFICMYPHFYETHNKLHHRHLGTDKDPTSASNSTTILGHLGKQAKYYISGANKLTILYWAFAILFFIIGTKLGTVFVIFGFLNWLMLEFVNYLQHLGISRDVSEKITYNHSWDTANPFTNIVCFNLGKHGNHHVSAREWHYNLSFKSENIHKEGYLLQGLLYLKPYKLDFQKS